MSIRIQRPAHLRVASLMLCCAVWLVACRGDDAPVAARTPPAEVVTTMEVQLEPWHDTIQGLGTVRARESVFVTAKVSETVARVHFDSGDHVSAGQVLVSLSDNQQSAALNAARVAAAEAESLLQRQQQLAEQRLIATAALDTQRATRDSARARVQELQAHISDRTIRAPFAGVLGLRQVSPGALVQPGTIIASLDDVSSVYVDFSVPEANLARLVLGQLVTGISTAYPEREFSGEISAIDARVDPTARALMVRATFSNDDFTLRPGMLLQVEAHQVDREALVLPEIAAIQIGPDTFVYRVREDETVEQVRVQIGSRIPGRMEVVAGIFDGDRIVIDGTGKLRPGIRIREAVLPDASEAVPDESVGRVSPTISGD